MIINSYKDLIVWQKSMDIVVEIYKVTNRFPRNEQYGLTSQMRRAAISIPSNIAEGYKRKHLPEYIQFLSIANGSGAELETQIDLCKRLADFKNFSYTDAEALLEEIMKMFTVLIQKLSTKRYALRAKP